MDRIKEAANVVIAINKYRNGQIEDYNLIKSVCSYFDEIKDEDISQSDLRFLKYISNIIGIPHFFDLLPNFKNNILIEQIDLNTLSSLMYESTLHTSNESKVHKYQKDILDSFEPEKQNRYFLSASTSFGKTHLVFEILKKMKYNNIVLIFPTIALLSENFEKVTSKDALKFFDENFKIQTLSEVEEIGERNLFIYTPERFLSFMEKNESNIQFDFVFVDEVYKIDNDYLIDEEVKENERDVAYRLAVFYALKGNADVLLAGPYIDFSSIKNLNYNNSFDDFMKKNNIKLLNYNNYEIVNKSFLNIVNKSDTFKQNDLSFEFKSIDKDRMLMDIISSINSLNENTIIYCPLRMQVERYPKKIIKANVLGDHDFSAYRDFINHISNNFKEEWTLINALKSGIGMHHGLVPKYIQKEIVSLFNKGLIKILISTTTITEGVNTSAKNLIVTESKKGDKELKKFDAKNIAGRAGRFSIHYSGRVIVLKNNFMDVIESEPEGIKHKNYDLSSPKSEIDLYYTDNEYLSADDESKKKDIEDEQTSRNLPDFVFEYYKVVSRIDKITIYDEIKKLTPSQLGAIPTLIRNVNVFMILDYDGFQVILNTILPIVKNQKLRFLIEHKPNPDGYSTLTHLVHFYLRGGFIGSMDYKIKNGKSIDAAIRETSDFVYNLLKYQLVKYLGVFNIMYKYYLSEKKSKPFEEMIGIDKLLAKLEYNALTPEGRIASDYGVPSNIVEYYENPDSSNKIKAKFDNYENVIFNQIDKIINKRD